MTKGPRTSRLPGFRDLSVRQRLDKLASFADLKVGDQFELLKEVEVARTLA